LTEHELRTESNKYNAVTAKTQGYQEIRNSAENWGLLMQFIEDGRARDLNLEPKKLLAPVILTGSGPSLDRSIEKLKDWKGDIICHYSQAVTLMYHGIEPAYIVALDAICNWEGLQAIDWSKTRTKLVLHPGMWPSLVQNWPNEMLLYRQNMGDPNSFGMNEQKVMYSYRQGTLDDALASRVSFDPLIKTELTMFACTPPAQLFVAQVLQYGAVFLTGMDFCYIDGKERFSNYDLVDGKWTKYEHLLDDSVERVRTETGFKSDPLHLYYKKNFISACRLSMQRVFTTDQSSITEMPYIPLEKVIKDNGKAKDIPPTVRERQYEEYLAKIGCFVINFDKGHSFVEAKNPINDITYYMQEKNRIYHCTTCGQTAVAKDDKGYDGEKCELCGNKTMKQSNPADIEANIKRIRKLI
jgi:DNA-directed RNA polymerase subunit RPC12/RpoP